MVVDEREVERHRMVETQLAGRGVRDARVLDAMRAVPRHRFVPADLAGHAYDDRPLSIGEGQTISQPLMVALMTEALNVERHHRVLEIGTGSGYQAAVLARLAAHVTSIERHATLAESARALLERLQIENVSVIVGDGTVGWLEGAPFDRILVTAGAPAVPDVLREQLAENGRLVIPVGTSSLQYLTTIDRRLGRFETSAATPCMFVPLVGKHGWPAG
jgi:protein-L-isoaspartate(D-aspartate) O-methyltransferase